MYYPGALPFSQVIASHLTTGHAKSLNELQMQVTQMTYPNECPAGVGVWGLGCGGWGVGWGWGVGRGVVGVWRWGNPSLKLVGRPRGFDPPFQATGENIEFRPPFSRYWKKIQNLDPPPFSAIEGKNQFYTHF